MRRAAAFGLAVALLAACSGSSSPTTYAWTATPEQGRAVAAARELDAQAAGVWAAYSDGLLLHFIYDFCEDLEAAAEVGAFLDERLEAQGQAVLLPLVVGSPYLCPGRRAEVGEWISLHAAQE